MTALELVLEKIAAEKEVRVKGYVRVRDGEREQVQPHVRHEDVAAEPPPEVPVDVLNEKKVRELALWRVWKEGGQKPADLRPLLKSFQPMIQSRAAIYKGKVRISPAAIDAEFQQQALAAFRTYDPEKGTLGTYVYRYLDKAKRFIVAHQNIARIPENRAFKIKEFQRAQAEMEESLGRPVEDHEMSGYLGWKLPEVARMSKEIRKDLWSHGFDEEKGGDPASGGVASRESEVLQLIKYELSPDERKVYDEYVGKGVESTSMIAQTTGFEAFKVSRLKKAIAQKMGKYLK